MKNYILLLFAIFCASMLCAQNYSRLSVVKLELVPNDTEASRAKKVDANRDKCALLKIQTPNMDRAEREQLVIEADRGTFIYPVEAVGEIKIFLTEGVKTLIFKHPDYGVLKYNVDKNIEGNKVYELVLEAEKTTQTPQNPTLSSNWVVVKMKPADAIVNIDGKLCSNGKAMLSTDEPHELVATHKYYHTLEKTIHASANEKMTYNFEMAPAFGWLSITSKPENDAVVLINGERKGMTPFRSDTLKSGEYEVTLMKEMFETVTKTVMVRDKNVGEIEIPMKATFANIKVVTDSESDIYIDDTKVGKGTWSGRLGEGEHIVEARKASHRNTVKKINVAAGRNDEVTVSNPVPIYGILNLNTTPDDAFVYLDGVKIGETPIIKNNVLIGEHKLKFEKPGCAPLEKTVTVIENQMVTVDEKLQTGCEIDTSLQLAFLENRTFTVNGVTFEMIAVKGGTFTMGCTSEQGGDCYNDEKPTHNVALSDYYIGKFEVTQKLWKAVMGSNPSNWKGDELPVESVSWNDVQEFITKLNQKTGANFRLPTEAEWEYVARGGNKSRGYKYSGSNKIGKVAWYTDNSGSKTHQVGTKSPNELGIYDMSGNVWEWCQDWYGSYSSSSQTNPTGPSSGSCRVLRGGSWNCHARDCRVSNRGINSPGYRSGYNGFRLVLVP